MKHEVKEFLLVTYGRRATIKEIFDCIRTNLAKFNIKEGLIESLKIVSVGSCGTMDPMNIGTSIKVSYYVEDKQCQ